MTARIPAAQGCSVSDRQPDLRIRLFGHVAVELDGAPFRLATPRKTLPILAYLLMNRDVRVARDFLAYVMWPDEEEESARSKLRMNLYELGRILPPSLAGSALLVTTDSVGVRPDLRLWLDVEEFDLVTAELFRLYNCAFEVLRKIAFHNFSYRLVMSQIKALRGSTGQVTLERDFARRPRIGVPADSFQLGVPFSPNPMGDLVRRHSRQALELA